MYLATQSSYHPESDCLAALLDFAEDRAGEVGVMQFLAAALWLLMRDAHNRDNALSIMLREVAHPST